MNKRKSFSYALILAAVGVIGLLGENVFANASTNTTIAQSFTTITIISILILVAAAAWLFWISFQ